MNRTSPFKANSIFKNLIKPTIKWKTEKLKRNLMSKTSSMNNMLYNNRFYPSFIKVEAFKFPKTTLPKIDKGMVKSSSAGNLFLTSADKKLKKRQNENIKEKLLNKIFKNFPNERNVLNDIIFFSVSSSFNYNQPRKFKEVLEDCKKMKLYEELYKTIKLRNTNNIINSTADNNNINSSIKEIESAINTNNNKDYINNIIISTNNNKYINSSNISQSPLNYRTNSGSYNICTLDNYTKDNLINNSEVNNNSIIKSVYTNKKGKKRNIESGHKTRNSDQIRIERLSFEIKS